MQHIPAYVREIQHTLIFVRYVTCYTHFPDVRGMLRHIFLRTRYADTHNFVVPDMLYTYSERTS